MDSLRKTDHERREELFTVYQNLPWDHKLILQILAITGNTSYTAIYTIAPKIDPLIKRDQIKGILKKSLDLDIIAKSYQDYMHLEPLLLVRVIEDAKERNTIETIEQEVVFYRRKQGWLYNNDTTGLVLASVVQKKYKPYISDASPLDENVFNNLHSLYNNPFNAEYISHLDFPTRIAILKSILKNAQVSSQPAPEAFEYARILIDSGNDRDGILLVNVGVYCLTFSRFADYDYFFTGKYECPAEAAAIAMFLRGDDETAIDLFDNAIKRYRKALHRSTFVFKGPVAAFYYLSLLRSGTEENRALLFKMLQKEEKQEDYMFSGYARTFSFLFDNNGFFLNGQLQKIDHMPQGTADCLLVLLRAVVICWRSEKPAQKHLNDFAETFLYLKKIGSLWLASEIANALFKMTGDARWQQQCTLLKPGWECRSIVDSIVIEEPWERALNTLSSITSNTTQGAQQNATRIGWRIVFPDKYIPYPSVACIEQKLLKNGTWNAGKVINPQKLTGKSDVALSEQDNTVIRILLSDPYSSDTHCAAIAALVEHPLVYKSEPPHKKIEICSAQPHLKLKKNGKNGYLIQLHPSVSDIDNEAVVLQVESPERLLVYQMQPEHRQMSVIIGSEGIVVPDAGRDRMLSAIAALSPSIKIVSDLDEAATAIQLVKSDSRPVLRLSGNRYSLSIEAVVSPVHGGRTFPPGHGNDAIFEYIDGKQIQTQRDLELEKNLFAALLQKCPTLDQYLGMESFFATVSIPMDCLEILSECKDCEPDVSILWLDCKPIRVSRQCSSSQMSLKIMDAASWFELKGNLSIDEQTTISFGKLIELIDSSDGRFVPLDDGTFLTLSKEFKKQLERLNAFTSKSGSVNRIHPLASLALGDIANKLEHITTSAAWKKRISSMEKILKKRFNVPATFQGELRDYQADGFIWLSRLAAMGAGACLADDMGLGKTIQAITLLLSRASDGPALVLAPTSVCKNWQDEFLRFGPTLSAALFSESNRVQCVKDASAGSVVICSYGLLNTSSEILCSIEWSSIVIDEAQAIKNMATQRSKAVMELKGRFRMVTTGTPVENHLGELWNIFRFINPGLLGTAEEFNRRFATPIQQRQDHETRQRLKTLISPFILRRLKSQVLDELPPKTESIVYVEPSKEEIAFYESLRRKALEDLTNDDPGGKHFRILAHIMKLRRACCSPSLAVPDISIKGSKLDVFAECVAEILDNNHRALVFSQFTDHLEIVKNYCESKKITYKYLDGSTPARERARRISEFQQGDGLLFLMSLKAGGVGINLTGADYVILLDPWWNPAVEDQATARAHRMGQERPVTIYRLITRGTIEEKIIDLHKHKRDLAESLLEGGDISGRMSAEELMKLIKDSVF